jgi:hypothetical protein
MKISPLTVAEKLKIEITNLVWRSGSRISDGTFFLCLSCSYIIGHAAVVDIGCIELFDILNRNITNYTTCFEP